MIDELHAKFLPRFLEGARGRIARARGGLDEGDRATVMHEMHALAGEAAMLELRDVARLARNAEQQARHWVATGADSDAASCGVIVDELVGAVAALSPS